LQLSEYRNFIEQLIQGSDIMEKNFYIIVPFSPIENKDTNFFSNISNIMNPQKNILEKRENFETYRNQLLQRVDHIIASLSGIGLRIAPLKTDEIIELLFDSYNPEIFNASGLKDIEKLELQK
jgi:hypothetical protein